MLPNYNRPHQNSTNNQNTSPILAIPTTPPRTGQSNGIQTTLHPNTDNIHWGDALYPTPATNFRILSKNVNSLPTTDHYAQWQAAAAAAQDATANVLCLQETNIRWEHNNHQAVQQIFRKSHDAAKISVSSSNEPSENEYQPGGTFTATLGPWTS